MLLEWVRSTLDAAGAEYALIGASALTVYGVSRATLDLDLLAMDPACLNPGFWAGLEARQVEVEVRRGSLDDPLAGVVGFRMPGTSSNSFWPRTGRSWSPRWS